MKKLQYIFRIEHIMSDLFNKSHLLACAFAIVSSSSSLAAPSVFSATESLRPGETIGLQGSDFGVAPSVSIGIVNSSGVVGTITTLAPESGNGSYPGGGSTSYMSARIPTTYGSGLYEVWVKDGAISSSPVFINRARITSLEFPEVDPGRRFRLFGRNLVVSGGTPGIRFVDNATAVSTSGTVIAGGNPYYVTVQAPSSLVPGHSYTIYYKNGLGGSVGEIASPVVLAARTGGADPFGLDMPWGPDFASFAGNIYNVINDSRLALHAAGNGIADDTAAIQAAINFASSSGGGVVYLPAGNYRIATFASGGVGITIKSNVVLQGDGQSATTVTLVPPTASTSHTGMVLADNTCNVAGILNLKFECATQVTGTSKVYAMVSTSNSTSKVFLQNVTVDGKYWGPLGIRLRADQGGRFLVSNCEVKNLRGDAPPITTKDYGSAPNLVSYIYIRNNSFPNFSLGMFLGARNVVYENNNLVYDGDYYNYLTATLGQPFGTGSGRNRINLSGPDISILNNTFSHVGAPFQNHNDGENLLAEDTGNVGGPTPQGTVSAATSNGLTDSAKAWTVNQLIGHNVVLIDGTGKGQVRTITANTATEITTDSPWTVVPPGGAKYSIVRLNVPHLLVHGNTMQDKDQVVELYAGAYDAAIVNNTAINSSNIWVRSVSSVAGHTVPLIGVLIADNTVTATSEAKPSMIRVDASYLDNTRFGTSVFLVEMRRNVVNSLGHEAFQLTNGNSRGLWHPANDTLPLGIQGAICDGNTVSNAMTAFGWVPGIEGMTVAGYTNQNVRRNTYDLRHADGKLLPGAVFTGTGTLSMSGTTGCVDLGSLEIPTQVTVEGMFKTTSAANMGILSNRGIGTVVVSMNAGKIEVWDNQFSGQGGILRTPLTYNDNVWHHFAWTCDGTNNKIYIDGSLKVTGARIRAGSLGTGRVGADVITNGIYPFVGELTEVRMWNSARTEAEVNMYRQTPLVGDEPTLVQYWPMNEEEGLTAGNAVLSGDVSNGLTSCWRADEGTGTSVLDSGSGGNPGTISGLGSVTWVPGWSAQALHFDGGSGYVGVPHNTNLDSSSMSVHARIKIDSISSSWPQNWRGIVYKGSPNATFSGWEFGTFARSNAPTLVGVYFRRGTGTGTVSAYSNTAIPLIIGEFYSVDATWDAATGLISIYMNGQLHSSFTNHAVPMATTSELGIGKFLSNGSFIGTIDDVRVYNRALSALEVENLSQP